MTVDLKRYRKRALMFGDGAKGMRLQVYGIYDGEDIDTGIRETAKKDNHRAPWVVTINLGETEYPNIRAALEAYETQGVYPPGYKEGKP